MPKALSGQITPEARAKITTPLMIKRTIGKYDR
jgi:hypothetical protein